VIENKKKEREEIRELFGLEDLENEFEKELRTLTQEELQIRELTLNKRNEAIRYLKSIWNEDNFGVFGQENLVFADRRSKLKKISTILKNEENSLGLNLDGTNSQNLKALSFHRMNSKLENLTQTKLFDI
jgi:hypothetical protein